MRILVACEMSGRVREAFTARGHYAVSCDLLPSLVPGRHVQGDCLSLINESWDMLLAFPPCTYLTRAAVHLRHKNELAADRAVQFVKHLWQSPIALVCIENPVGMLNKRWQYPSQVVNPTMFGDISSKKTCLWYRGLPPLMATAVTIPTASHVLAHRSPKIRSMLSPYLASAMAEQWG